MPEAGSAPAPAVWKTAVYLSVNTSRAKLVEQDGYAPSPPRCGRGVLLLSLQPQKVDTTAGLAPANLSFAGWSLGCSGTSCRKGKPRLRSLGVGRLLRRPSSMTAG